MVEVLGFPEVVFNLFLEACYFLDVVDGVFPPSSFLRFNLFVLLLNLVFEFAYPVLEIDEEFVHLFELMVFLFFLYPLDILQVKLIDSSPFFRHLFIQGFRRDDLGFVAVFAEGVGVGVFSLDQLGLVLLQHGLQFIYFLQQIVLFMVFLTLLVEFLFEFPYLGFLPQGIGVELFDFLLEGSDCCSEIDVVLTDLGYRLALFFDHLLETCYFIFAFFQNRCDLKLIRTVLRNILTEGLHTCFQSVVLYEYLHPDIVLRLLAMVVLRRQELAR